MDIQAIRTLIGQLMQKEIFGVPLIVPFDTLVSARIEQGKVEKIAARHWVLEVYACVILEHQNFSDHRREFRRLLGTTKLRYRGNQDYIRQSFSGVYYSKSTRCENDVENAMRALAPKIADMRKHMINSYLEGVVSLAALKKIFDRKK